MTVQPSQQYFTLTSCFSFALSFVVVGAVIVSDGGRVDVALQVAQVDTEPGWVYMVLQGATTLWETWTGSRYQPVYVMCTERCRVQ